MNSKRIAASLVRKFRTRDPFQLADALGYVVIRTPMKGIRGFYQYVKRCYVIYIDSTLGYQDARFVCAHEIGHALMHQGLNRIYMDSYTYFPTSKYEIEANHFAVDFLFEDDDLRVFLEYPIQLAADYMGVSIELAEYRMRSVT